MTVVQLSLVVVWAGSAVLVGVRRRTERTAPVMLAIACLAALGMLAAAADRRAAAVVAVALLAACTLHLMAALPTGRPPSRGVTTLVVVGYVTAAGLGLLAAATGPESDNWIVGLTWAAALVVGMRLANLRYRTASPAVRRRMQWAGWALAVVLEVMLVVVALRLMVHWPPHATAVVLAATGLVPLSIVAATHDRMVARVDRLLTATVSAAGLTALVIAAYTAVVVSLGRSLRDGERSLLLLSMVAAALAAVAYLPLRTRLTDLANQLVYGERVAPDEALRTWGSRLTRAIPLDELLLKLTE